MDLELKLNTVQLRNQRNKKKISLKKFKEQRKDNMSKGERKYTKIF